MKKYYPYLLLNFFCISVNLKANAETNKDVNTLHETKYWIEEINKDGRLDENRITKYFDVDN